MHALLSIVIASIASVTGDGRSALYVSSPEQNSFTTPDEEMFLEVEIDDETSNAASTVWLDGEMIFEMSDSAYTLPLPSLPLGQHQLSVHMESPSGRVSVNRTMVSVTAEYLERASSEHDVMVLSPSPTSCNFSPVHYLQQIRSARSTCLTGLYIQENRVALVRGCNASTPLPHLDIGSHVVRVFALDSQTETPLAPAVSVEFSVCEPPKTAFSIVLPQPHQIMPPNASLLVHRHAASDGQQLSCVVESVCASADGAVVYDFGSTAHERPLTAGAGLWRVGCQQHDHNYFDAAAVQDMLVFEVAPGPADFRVTVPPPRVIAPPASGRLSMSLQQGFRRPLDGEWRRWEDFHRTVIGGGGAAAPELRVWFEAFPNPIDSRDNWFTAMLMNVFPKHRLVLDMHDPHVMFCGLCKSPLGDRYRRRAGTIFVVVIYENMGTSGFEPFDFAIGHSVTATDGSGVRVPWWAMHYYHTLTIGPRDLIKDAGYNARQIAAAKTEFCVFLYQNCNGLYRTMFFRELSAKYKFVHSPGLCEHNIDDPTLKFQTDGPENADHYENRLDYIRKFKFVIAMENSQSLGYQTEKLPDALLAGVVPIYWGNPAVADYFNPKSFVNVMDYATVDEAIERIRYLDNNDDAYVAMLQESWLHGNDLHPSRYPYVYDELVMGAGLTSKIERRLSCRDTSHS